jgi:hypothetical protein
MAMANLKAKIAQVEEKLWRLAYEQLCRCRSEEDFKFFCRHGHLPEAPISGRPWQLEWTWEDFKGAIVNRSVEEKKFLLAHGYWPEQARENPTEERHDRT